MTKGLDIAIMTMKEGERAEFIIEPKYGYEEGERPENVPEDATIVFHVDLLKINPQTPDEILFKTAKSDKDQGNEYFKQNLLNEAK